MTETPRAQLVDPSYAWDDAGGVLVSSVMGDTTDWQALTLDYTPVYDRELILRVRGANASGTLTWREVVDMPLTASDLAAIADAVFDESLADHTAAGSAGERLGRIPNAAAGGAGGLPTVDASNKVAGVQGDTPQTGDAYLRLGAPAGASVSADIAAVKTDTGNLVSRLGAWAGTGANTVLGALRAVCSKVAAAVSDIGGTFSAATDSLEALQEHQASIKAKTDLLVAGTTPTIGSAVSAGGDLTIRRGDTVTLTFTYTGDISTRSKLWMAIKTDPEADADSASLLFVEETAGLTVLNGEAYANVTDGTITVSAGVSITVVLKARATAQLALAYGRHYDVQWYAAATGPVTILEGQAQVTADVVRATS
jgi:hypothetical protein